MGELKMYTLTCPECGKIQYVELADGLTEEQQNEEALKRCDCSAATEQRKSSDMHKRVDMLFGEDAMEAYGFSDSFDEKTIGFLKATGDDVLNGKYLSATVVLPNGERASFAIIKDQVKVSRIARTKAEAKV